ncbi:MAG: hypothetical protein E7635_02480 [Ruminococcaceae bacterium]|nr:hypothetical protein [Oscillospiraceae bacterium]
MIHEEIFASSRLSIMGEAVCTSDTDGALIYKNRAFDRLCRTKHCNSIIMEKVPEGDEILSAIYNFGGADFEFDMLTVDLFGEKSVICTDKKLNCQNFPIMKNTRFYTGFEGFGVSALIPVFGGRVLKLLTKSGSKNDVVEPMSDFTVGYFCLDSVADCAVRALKEKLMVYGFRIDGDMRFSQSPVCNVNLFDTMLVIQTLILAVMNKSNDRRVSVRINQREGMCNIIAEAACAGSLRDSRVKPEELFADDEESARVINSLVNFCSLYSWKLIARVKQESVALALCMPVHNVESVKFRNKTDKNCTVAIKQVMPFIEDGIEKIIKAQKNR